ncbi:FCD domain-containing protein [Rhodobacteraceae bacterium 2CG4]|uniref:FCD domain-containing protein n=1 Tax=Halovulum marinum TaxID=2662447 RepID=A0A6L5Z103_9RHOB|nr:GntR family transcriptional regulator [Halovulum marinum]MSU90243.1 FCD domain-containing protein [Halovulum marinum]
MPRTEGTEAPVDGPQGNQAYRALLEEIRTGRLRPGERLRETELAARLGVSRTPIREAIRQLEADGLVAHAPRQGATVRMLDYAEVMELYEMRAVLEGTAARLAAHAALDIEIEELESLNGALADAPTAGEAFRLNRIFHAALLDAAKNRFLHKSMVGLSKALMIIGPTTLSETDRRAAAVQEHQALLDALKARDGQAAEQRMRAHIEASQRVRIRSLRATAGNAETE